MSDMRENKVVEKEIMNPVWIDVNRVLEKELISSFVLRSFLVYEKERQNESGEIN